MSVKNKLSVQTYILQVTNSRAALANLAEWVESLPAPDDNNELHSLHYGHVGTIDHIFDLIKQAHQAADQFNE